MLTVFADKFFFSFSKRLCTPRPFSLIDKGLPSIRITMTVKRVRAAIMASFHFSRQLVNFRSSPFLLQIIMQRKTYIEPQRRWVGVGKLVMD